MLKELVISEPSERKLNSSVFVVSQKKKGTGLGREGCVRERKPKNSGRTSWLGICNITGASKEQPHLQDVLISSQFQDSKACFKVIKIATYTDLPFERFRV